MKKRIVNIGFSLMLILISTTLSSKAQIFAPDRDWADTTKYLKVGVTQDSIFVFFSTSNKLRAQFSDGSKCTYVWKKYDETTYPVTARFKSYSSGDSVLTDVVKGGYRVWVTRLSDDSTQVYTCWVMIDVVAITTMNIYNGCDFLELKTITNPTALGINNNNIFSYWDLTSPGHTKISSYSRDYFKNLTWEASNPEITVPSDASLTLSIIDPAPLFSSKYSLRIQNPFGRVLTYETDILPSKATKVDFTVYVQDKGNWTDGGTAPSGEALLKLKLESKAQNADSIFWRITNDEKLLKKQKDSIAWFKNTLFSDAVVYPDSTKMVPGTYTIRHISEKVSSGCRDTMEISVLVDTSAIKVDAIPNVFSPNNDGSNDVFKLKETNTNVKSIKLFKISILSRQGQLIYEYSGNPKEWNGWDGRIKGSSKEAPEGIYYYIIEAVGWDNKKFSRGKYKGFLYLYRGR